MFYASVATDIKSHIYFTYGYAHKYARYTHNISNKSCGQPQKYAQMYCRHTHMHTMIMHSNHSKNTRKIFTLTLMTKCIEWTLEVAFSTTVLQWRTDVTKYYSQLHLDMLSYNDDLYAELH